jgi:hypothetical protein
LKTVKIYLYELNMLIKSLGNVLKNEVNAKTAYRLSKLYRRLAVESDSLEMARMRLIKKYAEPGADGNPKSADGQYVFPEGAYEKFALEFQELTRLDVEIQFDPISIGEFGDIKLSGIDLAILDKFIQD